MIYDKQSSFRLVDDFIVHTLLAYSDSLPFLLFFCVCFFIFVTFNAFRAEVERLYLF